MIFSPVQTFPSLAPRSATENLAQRRYAAAGDRAYVVGTMDGDFPPMGWHIRGEMGGVWAHPIKLLDGYWFALNDEPLPPVARFASGLGHVQMDYPTIQGVAVTRTEFAPDGLPVVLVKLTLHSPYAQNVKLSVDVRSELMASYPWDWSRPQNTREFHAPDEGYESGGVLVFHKPNKHWYSLVTLVGSKSVRAVVGDDYGTAHGQSEYSNGLGGQLSMNLRLAANVRQDVWLVIAGSHTSFREANNAMMDAMVSPEALLRAKIDARHELLSRTQVNIPDAPLQAAFDWGKLNLADLRLTATNVQVRDVDEGRAYPEPLTTLNTMTGVAAGFPDYYELFGTDGAYTGYALVVSGQWDTLISHLRAIRDVSRAVNGATGKVVHEVMTDGSVYYGNNAAAGNTNETSQFAIAVDLLWRWSGDHALRDEMYAFVCDGLRYVMSTLDADGDYCPSGRGMVERDGMAGQTLDVAVYTWQALNGLAGMAHSKEDDGMYQWARANAAALQSTFDSAWWMPHENLYADSLDSCIQPELQVQQLHWINAVPLEMGVAPLTNANLVLDRMETPIFTGENGLYHTGVGGGPDGRGERRVWTLPNSVMAVAEANYGRLGATQALHYMRAIAHSLDLEMTGALPEVLYSPDYDPFGNFHERLMFMQAWSSYGVQYPIIHHMLGIEPFAPTCTLYVVPQLPPEWNSLSVSNLRVGNDFVAVTALHDSSHCTTRVDAPPRWSITLGHVLPNNAHLASVMLDDKVTPYHVEETTRGREVRVQTTGGLTHTLVVTLR